MSSEARNTGPAPRDLVEATKSINRHVFDGHAELPLELGDITGALAHCERVNGRYVIRIDRTHFANEGNQLTAHLLIMIAHELGHYVAGLAHGHDPVWQQVMAAVGIRTTGKADDAAIPGGRFDVWRRRYYPNLPAGWWPDLLAVPKHIKAIGARIAAGGRDKDAALQDLAKLAAIDPSVDPKIIALALDYAKNGYGKPCPPELDYLLDDAGRVAINAAVKRSGSNDESPRQHRSNPENNSEERTMATKRRVICIAADSSTSMCSENKYELMNREISRITSGPDDYRLIAICSNSVDVEWLSAIPLMGYTDIAGAIRCAMRHDPDELIVIADGRPNSETEDETICISRAFHAADEFHVRRKAPITTVYIAGRVIPHELKFMQDLARRTGGKCHQGAAGDGTITAAISGREGGSMPSDNREVEIFKRGDAAVMDGDTGRGAREMLHDVVAHVQNMQQQAATRYGEKSEEYQRQMQRALKSSMDGLERRAALFISERERQQLEHHWNMLNQQLDDLAEMGERMDDQAIHALRQHKEHYDEVQGRSAAVFQSGRKALHESFNQEIAGKEIEGSWNAPARYLAAHEPRRQQEREPLRLHDIHIRRDLTPAASHGDQHRNTPRQISARVDTSVVSSYLAVVGPRSAPDSTRRLLPPRRS